MPSAEILSGFPKWVDFWEGKFRQNCMKITKSTFWGQNSGGHEGMEKPIFRVVVGPPQSALLLPLGETLTTGLHISKRHSPLW